MKTGATMTQDEIMIATPYSKMTLEETGCATGFMIRNRVYAHDVR
jgi:hypothetical protein